jgi:hypothetical protein
MNGRPPSTFQATLAVAWKELVSGFRDRQTTLSAVVLPIVLYPALFWCALQGMLLIEGRRETTPVEVGLAAASPDDLPHGLATALEQDPLAAQRAELDLDLGERNRVVLVPLGAPIDAEGARAWLAGGDRDPARDAPRRPDAVLHVGPPGGEAGPAGGARLPPFCEKLRAEAAAARGLAPSELDPFLRDRALNLARRGDMVTYVLSFILPILMVVMTLMGAFFPAVDLTAGERERSTAETTLLLPVKRLAVHQGKILAVCATAMISATLNLFALAFSAGHLLTLASATEVAAEVPLAAFLAVAPLAALFAFFVSAVLTGVASLARTFREGQALLGPVQLVFLLPALAAAIPGLELGPGTALVPVVNVVLAFRSMLRGEVLPLEYLLTALSLLVLAALAVLAAVRMLARESALLGGPSTRGRRRPAADAR